MLSFLSSVIKKGGGEGGPVNIQRHGQRKLLTSVSGNSNTILSVATTENDSVDVTPHKNTKKHFKDSEAHESWRSVRLFNKGDSDEARSPEMEILTDNENHNRQSDDSLTYSEETVKEKFGLEADVNFPDSKVECEEMETEMKLERKRKPMVIASHITVAQGTVITHIQSYISCCAGFNLKVPLTNRQTKQHKVFTLAKRYEEFWWKILSSSSHLKHKCLILPPDEFAMTC
jgi:hypothetical protein